MEHWNDRELIKKCIRRNAKAIEEIYKRFSSKMYGICLRYTRNSTEARDLLHDGFIRVLENLKLYDFQGSLQAWMARVMINTAINYYRKNKLFRQNIDIEEVKEKYLDDRDYDIISEMSADELLKVIQNLPDGYRLIFNLYAIEGYKHKEIAEMLNISENTSKTQLRKARMIIQKKLKILLNEQ